MGGRARPAKAMFAMLRSTTLYTFYFYLETITKWMIDKWNKVKVPPVYLKGWCIARGWDSAQTLTLCMESGNRTNCGKAECLGKHRL